MRRFELQLGGIVRMLVGATATLAKYTATGNDPPGRGLKHLKQIRLSKVFFGFVDMNKHALPGKCSVNKTHPSIFKAPHTRPAIGHPLNKNRCFQAQNSILGAAIHQTNPTPFFQSNRKFTQNFFEKMFFFRR